jgi:predicted small metal-binding protein
MQTTAVPNDEMSPNGRYEQYKVIIRLFHNARRKPSVEEVRFLFKEFDCGGKGGCWFMIRSENDDEIVTTSQKHVKEQHNMELGRDDIMKATKPFSASR